ncbi:MAG: SIMPL domain-containing protein [Candidatus Pacebacteria bacterium]|nr:SIMPL domain-containing protein [Candidatus Paceibacterota bacterium]
MKNTHAKALYYTGALFLLILSVLAIAITVFVTKGNQQYDENTISVTGTAEVSSVPDIATFSFTVKETADDAKTAQKTINEKITKILDGLDNLNVDEKDIKTESYTIYPKYEWVKVQKTKEIAPDGTVYFPGNNQKRVQVGFDVSQNVRVKLRDLEKVSDALTLFAENAVENLNGPHFEIDDLDGIQEEARLEAIKKAKTKAKRLAKDLEVKLGKIVSFNENGGGYQPVYQQNMMMAKGMTFDGMDESYAPSLPVGENDITATVTITYKIK